MNRNELFTQFIEANEAQLKALVEAAKAVLDNPGTTIENESTVMMLELLKELCLHDEKIEEYLGRSELEEVKGIIASIVHEESELVMGYFDKVNKANSWETVMLKTFEWKFVGVATCDNFDKGIIMPKIIVKLFFTDGSEKVFETDYATIKKWQEEVEESANWFNSTYARRIETFAK